jgi:two-component system, cell cycle sensor histidine kinase and response regulator CckA
VRTARRRVLVVDDDADQLETLRRGLFLLGIECLPVRDLAAALEQLDRVDLLLTDQTRPGKPGAELIARARAMRPELPVLVITGLALSPEVMALRACGIPILRKPFTADQLGLAIETLLKGELE